MKIKANIVVVLFFFFFPLVILYILFTSPKELLGDRKKLGTYFGLLVCWVMLWMPVVAVYRLLTGSL